MQGFVDETKAKNYRMVLVAIDDANINRIRRELRKVRTPTKSPVHFQTDSDEIKDVFLSTISGLPFLAYSISSRSKKSATARASCLSQIVLLAEELELSRLVLELDESLRLWDLRTLKGLLQGSSLYYRMNYLHLTDREEICLTLADAIAWCLNRGGYWANRITPLVSRSIDCD